VPPDLENAPAVPPANLGSPSDGGPVIEGRNAVLAAFNRNRTPSVGTIVYVTWGV